MILFFINSLKYYAHNVPNSKSNSQICNCLVFQKKLIVDEVNEIYKTMDQVL
jgi:hypothetical protein